MVPDAPIDGKLPSVKPEDRSGDFTFSRGSNLSATRVNKDGLIEKGRENLLLQSNQFDTTWLQVNSNVTSGQSGYDGSSDAWLLSKSGATGLVKQDITQSGVQAFSIYAKAGTSNWMRLLINGVALAYYDLSNGVVGATLYSTFIDAQIEDVGGGWYRCSLIGNGSTTLVNVVVADADNDTSGTSGSIYIQDAQLELGLVATGYIETTTATVQKGILENLPRLDYSGGASCPSLLLEPQRSNLITHSEYFETSEWTTPNVVFETNKAISPDGEFNATKFKANSANSTHWASTDLTLTSGQDYTFKLYVKSAEYDWVQIALFGTGWVGSTKKINFNASTGEFGTTDTGITFDSNPMGNGWHEVIITNEAASTSGVVRVYPMPSDNATSYQGDGASGIYIYGAQFEQGSYPTSYIPTYGSSVTRSQEYGRTTHSAYEVNEEQGVIFAEFEYLGGKDFQVVSMHNGGALVNWLMIDTAGNLRGSVFYDNAFQVTMNSSPTTLSPNTNYKAAFRYESGNNVLYLNGVKVGTNTSTFTNPPTLPYIQVGGFWQLSNTNVNCKLKQALLFNTSLTDDECIALTTI